MPVKEA
jgi:vacuolar protein sorting-associated protein 1